MLRLRHHRRCDNCPRSWFPERRWACPVILLHRLQACYGPRRRAEQGAGLSLTLLAKAVLCRAFRIALHQWRRALGSSSRNSRSNPAFLARQCIEQRRSKRGIWCVVSRIPFSITLGYDGAARLQPMARKSRSRTVESGGGEWQSP